jgi:hypothetical protein
MPLLELPLDPPPLTMPLPELPLPDPPLVGWGGADETGWVFETGVGAGEPVWTGGGLGARETGRTGGELGAGETVGLDAGADVL